MYKTEGIVLRTRNLGEADKVVTLYTKTHGKVAAAARGSRRVRNRLLGVTQIFTHGRYLLFEGKSLDSLSQGEILHSFQPLRDDLDTMAQAMYITELVDVFVEESEPHVEIFHLLLQTLQSHTEDLFVLAVRAFELRLMAHLGYQPQLELCLNCGCMPEQELVFSREGGILCSDCRTEYPQALPLSRGTWQLMQRLLFSDWRRLFVLRPSPQHLQELQACLRQYIDFRLERPLRSLGFLTDLQVF